MDSTGAAACVQVNFTPQGAHRFFGFPMSELAARMVTLDDLGDRDILRLREQLGAEPDWERRLDITERFVAARLRRSRGADAAVNWAYRHILASRGTVRMSRIARELGWSRKHLTARFHRELGLAPKSIARIARFQNVLSQARAAFRRLGRYRDRLRIRRSGAPDARVPRDVRDHAVALARAPRTRRGNIRSRPRRLAGAWWAPKSRSTP